MGRAGVLDATRTFAGALPGEWTSIKIPLSCFAAAGANMRDVSQPFVLTSKAAFTLSIVGIRLDADPTGAACPAA